MPTDFREKNQDCKIYAQHPFFDASVKYSYHGPFADGRVLEVRSDFGGTKFTGENGWNHVDCGKLLASDREILRNLPDDFNTKPPSHYQNFIDCVRSRELTVAPAEAAHRAASFGQLAIVALDTKNPSSGTRNSKKFSIFRSRRNIRALVRVLQFDQLSSRTQYASVLRVDADPGHDGWLGVKRWNDAS